MTTLYFEAEKEDDLRKVGYSKERRVDPQVVVGLLVDRAGFPLEIGCFEGNKAETTTIIPIVKAFQARHNLTDMVVVADAGMLSATNLKELRRGRAAVHRRLPGDQGPGRPGLALPVARRRVHRRAGHRHDHPTGDHGRGRADNDQSQRAEPVWDPSEHPGSWRAVWAYSAKRAARDGKTLTAAGEPGQGRRRRGEGRPHAAVRHHQQRHPRPWTRRRWPGPGGWSA